MRLSFIKIYSNLISNFRGVLFRIIRRINDKSKKSQVPIQICQQKKISTLASILASVRVYFYVRHSLS